MIKFVSTNCDVQDYVEGILMTVDGFSATRIRNDNLSSQQRCDDGRLIVDGLAIGPGLDFDLVQARRARLYDRFNIADVLQNQKVFEGASILLRTNPALRSNLPPGADGFLRDIQLVR
ncbi:MAG: hypothetical protein Q8O99_05050 [bacterium]|nr:hypothetical protein [bacterium]